MGHIPIEVGFIYREPETMRQFSERAVTIDNVIRNGNNVKPGLSEEINSLSQFHRTVGVFRVNVEITQ
jgi:hypothetical protein